jgi:hypothetical protein
MSEESIAELRKRPKLPYEDAAIKAGMQYERRRHILAERVKGVSFPKIATELGLTQGYVFKQYKLALKSAITEDVSQVRKIELARLDELQEEVIKIMRSFNPMVSGGKVVYDVVEGEVEPRDGEDEVTERVLKKLEDPKVKFDAVNTALRIMDRRAKLLGLDAPVKAELSGPDGGPIQQYAAPRPMTREELVTEAAARGLPTTIFET